LNFKTVLLLVIIASSHNTSYCQNNNIEIIQSEKVDSLFLLQSSKCEKWLSGCRILIAENPEKTKIDSLSAEINHLYPKIETYIIYSKENFQLLIGDFWNENEAHETFTTIKPLFPNAIVLKSQINLNF
jgi:hypothetical protein